MDNALFARVLAMHVEALGIVATVEAMKAENANREHRGEAQAYGEETFATNAKTLLYIADQMQAVSRA